MKKIIIPALASIFSITIIFHLLVLLRIIPFTIIWGGKIKTAEEMYAFESASLFLNIIFLALVLLKARALKKNAQSKGLDIFLYCIAVLFALNTAGNLFSESTTEKIIFTPLTVLLAVFMFMLARTKSQPAK